MYCAKFAEIDYGQTVSDSGEMSSSSSIRINKQALYFPGNMCNVRSAISGYLEITQAIYLSKNLINTRPTNTENK